MPQHRWICEGVQMYSNEYQHIHLMNYSRFHGRANRQPLDLGFGHFSFLLDSLQSVHIRWMCREKQLFHATIRIKDKNGKVAISHSFPETVCKAWKCASGFFSVPVSTTQNFSQKKERWREYVCDEEKNRPEARAKTHFESFFSSPMLHWWRVNRM